MCPFLAIDEACCSGTRFGFVATDERNRLEGEDCPIVAVIGRTGVGKMVKHCCCIARAGLFWVLFWRLVVLPAVDLNSGLLMVLRRVQCQCRSVQRSPRLVIRTPTRWMLDVVFYCYAAPARVFCAVF